MEERSGWISHSGGVVKSRSSSGCLIVKKQVDLGVDVDLDLDRGLRKEKKSGFDSVSSDEELRLSGVNQGSSRPPRVYKRGVVNHGSFSNEVDDVYFGRVGLMRGMVRKKKKVNVYEYDDLSDDERLGVRYVYERQMGNDNSRVLSSRSRMKSGNGLEFDSESDVFCRGNSFNSSASSMGGEKICSFKRRFEVEEEVPKKKLCSLEDAIRLQGKNGVLKVMVKKKKDTLQLNSRTHVQEKGEDMVSSSQELASRNVVTHSNRILRKKPLAMDWLALGRQTKGKSPSIKSSEDDGDDDDDEEAESEGSDSSSKLPSDSVNGHHPFRRMKSEENMQTSERVQPIRPKKGRVKRSGGTEKQLLREKIRNMLVNAGWTIDYKPRRGQTYCDTVYINPVGTAYWSIIKAYDALQKQLEEEGNNSKARAGAVSSSLASLSDDILSKLTRQTTKKIEKELKRKKSKKSGDKRKKGMTRKYSCAENTDSGKHNFKLSSFKVKSGKSLKSVSKEANFLNGSIILGRGEKSSSMQSIHGSKSKKIGRCTLLVRNSGKGLESDGDMFVPFTGKRNLLSWLIDSRTVQLNEKVHYMNRRCTRIMLEGWITRDGIHCACCSKILTISKFEIHAIGKPRQAFLNMYLSSGVSLLQCQVDAWNKQNESQRNGFHEIGVLGDDPSDDTCAICADGGSLICCDSCPSTFHQNCLDIQTLPPGDWHCLHCSCKFCGLAEVCTSEEHDARLDMLTTCSLCERKYHNSCMKEAVDTLVKSTSFVSFCGKECQELFVRMQKLLGVKHELEGGLCWSLIHRTDLDLDTSDQGYPHRVESNSKLAVALTVMDECFLPIIDRRSGINLIHNVLYNCGSNFSRLNCSNFYTAILERGDEIVSAASIRIRGRELAEMPFIGTRHIYRRRGMCRRLLYAIEMALRSLKVKNLIIPAISELMDTWTKVFGFSALGHRDKQVAKTLNVLAFPGIDMLRKKLINEDRLKRGVAGGDTFEVVSNSLVVPDLKNKYNTDVSPGLSSSTALLDYDKMNANSVSDFCSQDAVASVEETLRSTSEGICNEVKPSNHSAIVDISNDVKTLESSELNGETLKLRSIFQLETNLHEASSNVKVSNLSDGSADILEVGKYLNDSSAEHDVDTFTDHKSTQEASPANPVTLFPPSKISSPPNSDALSNYFLRDDVCSLIDEPLHPKIGSAAQKECQSLPKAAQNSDKMENSMITSPDEGFIQDAVKFKADNGAYEGSAEVADVCSSSQALKLPTLSGNMLCRSQNASRAAVEMEKPWSDSCCIDTNQQTLEDEIHLAHDISVGVSVQSINSSITSGENDRTVGLETVSASVM